MREQTSRQRTSAIAGRTTGDNELLYGAFKRAAPIHLFVAFDVGGQLKLE
jgi:hypothetical protein